MAAAAGSPPAALDLSMSAKEMKKKYCPHGKKTGAQDPPPTWRSSVERVTQFYGLSIERQKQEKEKWKGLCRTEKDRATKAVPGYVARDRAPRAVATRTREATQRRQRGGSSTGRRGSTRPQPSRPVQLPDGMASSEAARKAASESITRGGSENKKKKRARKDSAASTAQQNDVAVRDARRTALLATGHLAQRCHAGFANTKQTPRQYALTIVVNEVEDAPAMGGRPSKMPKRREKPEIFICGSGKDVKHNPVLKHVMKAIQAPENYEIHSFLHDDPIDNNENTSPNLPERVAAHLKQCATARGRPSQRVASNRQTSQNVPKDATTSVLSPSKVGAV